MVQIVFRDPQQRPEGVPASKSENQIGTLNQEVIDSSLAPARDPDSPLERALQQLGGVINARLLMNKDGGMVPATRPTPQSGEVYAEIEAPAEAGRESRGSSGAREDERTA